MSQHYSVHPLETPDHGWRNWARNVISRPQLISRPTSDDSLIDEVRRAVSSGLPISAAGSGHSFSPLVPTDGLLLDLREFRGVTGIDRANRRVRMRAGTQIRDVYEPLWAQGLALRNQGDIDHQTVIGAISTATHGSGITLGSFSSALRWVRFIDGNGEVREVGEEDPRQLNALATSLGLLGVVIEFEIEVAEAYDLHEEISLETWEVTAAHWDENVAAHRHYSFFWLPGEISASLYNLRTPSGVPLENKVYTKVYREELAPEPARRSEELGRRRDRAYRIYPDFDPSTTEPFHELEYYVSAEDGLAATNAIRDLIRQQFHEQLFPLELRWTAAEDAFLAPTYHRASAILSISGEMGTDYLSYFRAFDRELQQFDARAHWGKIHFLDRDRVQALYPAYEDFQAVRRDIDPAGLFLNEHTRALFG